MARKEQTGLSAGVAAYGIWGLFPLYWPLLEPESPAEILAIRVLLAALCAGLLVRVVPSGRGAMRALGPAAKHRLVGAGLLITVNWGVYIWGVNHGHVVETSLGYFITPLISVAFGVVIFHERLRPAQWAAIAVGLLAVIVLTVDYGRPPWVALTLALSFGVYGLVKKQLPAVPAMVGLATETVWLALPALVVVLVIGRSPLRDGTGHALLLLGTGPLTVVPLLLFAAAARRLPMSRMGLLQYLAPVGQLAIGVAVRHEPLGGVRLAGFILVWAALLIVMVDGLRHRGRRSAIEEAAVAEAV